MSIILMSAIPNSILGCGLHLTITPSTAKGVRQILFRTRPDLKEEEKWVSAVGHENTAQIYSVLLRREIKFNRMEVKPTPEDTIICGLFTPPRRLGEGEKWTEEEILSFQINWVVLNFYESDPIEAAEEQAFKDARL
ncbi:DUF1874 domain-containing protein [Tolypothrix sp. PCC 7910]|uniref:STIV orfB116 family protein n=1 Tax=Tolypothrix sp. PCC 7910 TaxID=2099387 RepID=UPI00142777E4|nr:DUF1874 domain-containing protein [Tolypothrix sp. PCC 7910]QIR36830.1 DUF1874 domain-containing protein [Tolypothrix sp. PCC 7910]